MAASAWDTSSTNINQPWNQSDLNNFAPAQPAFGSSASPSWGGPNVQSAINQPINPQGNPFFTQGVNITPPGAPPGMDWAKVAQGVAGALQQPPMADTPSTPSGSISIGQTPTGLMDYYSRLERLEPALMPQDSDMGLLSAPRRNLRR
jgi:hypothetical protein